MISDAMSRPVRHGIVLLVVALTAPAAAGAQQPQRYREGGSVAAPALDGSALLQSGRTGGAAFLIETLGGTAGSAIGFGIGVLLANADACGTDDLRCQIENAAVALGTSAVGAAFGAWGAGRLADTRPSGVGAALGSLAGTVAGLGVVHLLTEEFDLNVGNDIQLVSYMITHGVITALGSRLIAAIGD